MSTLAVLTIQMRVVVADTPSEDGAATQQASTEDTGASSSSTEETTQEETPAEEPAGDDGGGTEPSGDGGGTEPSGDDGGSGTGDGGSGGSGGTGGDSGSGGDAGAPDDASGTTEDPVEETVDPLVRSVRSALKVDPPADVPGPASGGGVTPTMVDGNAHCADEGIEEISPSQLFVNNTISDGFLTITITAVTFNNEGEPTHFSFTSNIGVDAVQIKAGSNTNIFSYNETFGDTGLHGPYKSTGEPHGISHLNFCYDLAFGSLDVNKVVDGEGEPAEDAEFTIEVDCPGTSFDRTLVFDASGELTDGGPLPIANIPEGFECTFSETGDGDADDVTLDPASGEITIVGNQTVTATVTNTFDQEVGSLGVDKVVDGTGTPDPSTTFTIHVDCDDLLDLFDQDLVFDASGDLISGTLPIANIPLGTLCTITETDTGGADNVTLDPVSGIISILTEGQTASATVTNTFDQEVGSLDVDKIVDGLGAPAPGTTFTVDVNCDDDAFDTTLVFDETGALTTGTLPITGIPVGTMCTISETDQGGADAVTLDPVDGIVTIDEEGQTVTVTVTNTFREHLGSLDVLKVVAGLGTPEPGTTFTVNVDCDDDTFDQDLTFDEAGLLTAGGPLPITGIPAGTVCTITETDTGDADLVTLDPVTGQVTIVEDQTVTATVTNTFDIPVGSLDVLKVVDGLGTPEPGTTFTVNVDCDDDTFDQDLTFDENGDLTAGTLPITGIPVGTICTIAETDTGDADDVTLDPVGGIVTIDTEGQTVTATVTNTFDQEFGSLNVIKAFDGDGTPPDGTEFTINVDCDDDAFDQDLVFDDEGNLISGTLPITNILVGTVCTVTETDDGGAEAVTLDPASGIVTILTEGQTVTATVTNTFITEITGLLDKTNDADLDGTFGEPEEALEEGQDVEFQLIITNTSPIPVTITAITDTFGGDTITITDCRDAGDTNVIGSVLAALGDAPANSVTCFFTLPGYAPDPSAPLDNTAEVVLASEFDEVRPTDDSRVTSPEVFGGVTPRPPGSPRKDVQGGLAATGVPLGLMAVAAMLLLSLGTVLRRSGRRRSQHGF